MTPSTQSVSELPIILVILEFLPPSGSGEGECYGEDAFDDIVCLPPHQASYPLRGAAGFRRIQGAGALDN